MTNGWAGLMWASAAAVSYSNGSASQWKLVDHVGPRQRPTASVDARRQPALDATAPDPAADVPPVASAPIVIAQPTCLLLVMTSSWPVRPGPLQGWITKSNLMIRMTEVQLEFQCRRSGLRLEWARGSRPYDLRHCRSVPALIIALTGVLAVYRGEAVSARRQESAVIS